MLLDFTLLRLQIDGVFALSRRRNVPLTMRAHVGGFPDLLFAHGTRTPVGSGQKFDNHADRSEYQPKKEPSKSIAVKLSDHRTDDDADDPPENVFHKASEFIPAL
jgi:hypothetical protein